MDEKEGVRSDVGLRRSRAKSGMRMEERRRFPGGGTRKDGGRDRGGIHGKITMRTPYGEYCVPYLEGTRKGEEKMAML